MTASTCTIPECLAPARTRGLCPKHYMRTRRHGDANGTRRRGPKPDAGSITALARAQLSDLSPRTQARFARALRIIRYLNDEFGFDFYEKALKDATRPKTGSINVAAMLRTLERVAARFIAIESAVEERPQ